MERGKVWEGQGEKCREEFGGNVLVLEINRRAEKRKKKRVSWEETVTTYIVTIQNTSVTVQNTSVILYQPGRLRCKSRSSKTSPGCFHTTRPVLAGPALYLTGRVLQHIMVSSTLHSAQAVGVEKWLLVNTPLRILIMGLESVPPAFVLSRHFSCGCHGGPAVVPSPGISKEASTGYRCRATPLNSNGQAP